MPELNDPGMEAYNDIVLKQIQSKLSEKDKAAIDAAWERHKWVAENPVSARAHFLCLAIEDLPAGEQQTKLSIEASKLSQEVQKLESQLKAPHKGLSIEGV